MMAAQKCKTSLLAMNTDLMRMGLLMRLCQKKAPFRKNLGCKSRTFEGALQVSLRRLDASDGFTDRMLARSFQKKGRVGAVKRGRIEKRHEGMRISAFCISIFLLTALATAKAQTHQLIRGTVTAVSNGVFTMKPDAGGVVQVKPDPAATIQKVAIGSTDLKSAVAAVFSDISVGDRVLISANVPDSGPAVARMVIVVKAAEIGQRKAADQADWQKRGVGGLVRFIDLPANRLAISAVGAAETTTLTIQLTEKTRLMRYASDSVRFSDAKPEPMAMIQIGDQLRARGEKSTDGRTVTADEIVTGSFRNISGQIIKVDISKNMLTMKDITTKAVVTVALTGNTDTRVLPLKVATGFVVRLKGEVKGASASGQGDGGRSVSSDLTQMISILPSVTLAQLKPGDALMIAAAASTTTNSVTAITLLSGVEPILTAAPADSAMTLEPWSLNSGAAPQ